MSEPIVFISHFRIKEGGLEAFTRHYREGAKALEAEKPRTVAFLAYVSQDGTRATIVHVFADSESMDLHNEGWEERARGAYAFIDAEGFEIYGRPSDSALEMMGLDPSGADPSAQSRHLGGFLRLR